MSRDGDAALHKLGLVANAKKVPTGSPNKVLRDLFAQNGMTHSRDEHYIVPFEQRKSEGWKSTGLRAPHIPANEGTDAQAPKRFSSLVLNNGL